MLREQDKRVIRSRLRAVERAEDSLREKRSRLADTLALTRKHTAATLAELGEVCGVSRQRIHQILKGE